MSAIHTQGYFLPSYAGVVVLTRLAPCLECATLSSATLVGLSSYINDPGWSALTCTTQTLSFQTPSQDTCVPRPDLDNEIVTNFVYVDTYRCVTDQLGYICGVKAASWREPPWHWQVHVLLARARLLPHSRRHQQASYNKNVQLILIHDGPEANGGRAVLLWLLHLCPT